MSTNKSNPSNPDGITGKLSLWVYDTSFSDIPSEIIERAKYLILDGLACGLVAAHLPWSETATKAIFKMESPGPCTIMGWDGKKISPVAAATLNSAFIQGFELDDYHSKAPLHSNSIILPALFAATEADSDSTVSGTDLLRAYVIGCEVGPRVGLALRGADLLSRGWHSGALQGPSASAAAVASLLGLSPAEIEWALGIACTQAGGLMSAQFGSMAKRMQHGFASRNGLLGALLAKEGYTGIEQVYEQPYGGFLSCFSAGASVEPKSLPDQLIDGLGSRWELNGVRVKVHAAMGALPGTIESIEQLQTSHPDLFRDENLDNIEKIVTVHSKPAFEHGGFTTPRDKPMTSVAAQMSIQYVAAAQLIDHEVLMSQFGAAKLNRPYLRDLMTKIQPTYEPKLDDPKGEPFKTIVTVLFKDGTKVTDSVAAPKGVATPLPNEEIVDKWRRLVSGILDDKRRNDIEEMVLGLDKLSDVKSLINLLDGDVKCPIDV